MSLRSSCSALAVFLGLALFTYNPADPPGSLVFPLNAKIANACGRSGAVAAEMLLEAFGLGAYFLVLSLAVVDGWLLTRRPITEPLLRGAGWLMALAGVSTLLAMGFHGATPGPVIGPGGYLGAGGRAVLEMNFARPGAFILTVSLTLAGLLLATDYLLVRAALWSLWIPLAAVLHIHRQVRGNPPAKAKSASRKGKATDLEDAVTTGDEADAEDEEAAAPAVRIRGKRLLEADAAETDEAAAAVGEESADAEGNADSESEEGESASETSSPGLAARVGSALRIRNLGKSPERDEGDRAA